MALVPRNNQQATAMAIATALGGSYAGRRVLENLSGIVTSNANRYGRLAMQAYRGFGAPPRRNPKRKSKPLKQLVIKKPKTLKKQVAQLSKAVKADQAYHTYKFAGTTRNVSSANQVNHTNPMPITITSLENTAANLRYYDPTTPGTLITANAATGTYSRAINYQSIHATFVVRNSYDVPAKVTAYLVTPKGDTNIDPLTYYSNGVTDQVISGATTSPELYLSDIDVFKEQWAIKVLKKKLLQPGQEFTVTHTVKDINYDPALVDSHSLSYQKKYKNFAVLFRVEGVIGHDTTITTEQGMLGAGVDIDYSFVAKIVYDAGVNLNDIYIDAQRDSFTNGGVTGMRPLSDNQAFSVA